MVTVTRTYRQQILRQVRRHTNDPLHRFKLVNDDDLGQTYVAAAVRGPGYVIVEMGVDDPNAYRYESRDGMSVQFVVIKRGVK